jgi:hypothetical protein
MSSQPPELPQKPPQPSKAHQTLAQRIEGLTIPQTVAAGIGVGCSILLVACLALSALGLALGRSNSTQGSVSAIAAIPTATDTDDATATAESTATIRIHPTATTRVQPTRTPSPHPTNAPTPTNTPCADPCNPWGYNFDPTGGSQITSPPSTFCSYFACIGSPPAYTNFWSGQGYVVECQDTLFSKTGGTQNSCSHHGGELRTLYAHG